MNIDPARTLGFGLAFLTLAVLERVLPMFSERRPARHDIRNLLLGGINNALLIFAFSGLWVMTMDLSAARNLGLLQLMRVPEPWQTVTAILLFDCWQYWWHRLNHRIPLLWRFHAVHHADNLMDASSAVRFHTGEIALSALARLAVLPLIGMQPGQLLLYESMLLPVILFHHSNLRFSNKADRLLRWLIPTPWMHWVHHSRIKQETDSNYSSFLSVWDRIFGTFRLNPDPGSISFGLDGFDDEERQTLTGMLLTPLKTRLYRKNMPGDSPAPDTDN